MLNALEVVQIQCSERVVPNCNNNGDTLKWQNGSSFPEMGHLTKWQTGGDNWRKAQLIRQYHNTLLYTKQINPWKLKPADIPFQKPVNYCIILVLRMSHRREYNGHNDEGAEDG